MTGLRTMVHDRLDGCSRCTRQLANARLRFGIISDLS